MIFPEARQCADLVADPNLAENILVRAVLQSIVNAIANDAASTVTFSFPTYGGPVIPFDAVLQDLRQKGYTVTTTASEVTITWGNA